MEICEGIIGVGVRQVWGVRGGWGVLVLLSTTHHERQPRGDDDDHHHHHHQHHHHRHHNCDQDGHIDNGEQHDGGCGVRCWLGMPCCEQEQEGCWRGDRGGVLAAGFCGLGQVPGVLQHKTYQDTSFRTPAPPCMAIFTPCCSPSPTTAKTSILTCVSSLVAHPVQVKLLRFHAP
jgi:hypothetical protein